MEQSHAEIEALLHAQSRDHAAGDAAAVMSAYRSDAVLFDLPPPLQVKADADGLQEWIDGWDSPPTISYHGLSISVSGKMAMAWGFVHTKFRRNGEDGGFWTRATWSFRREARGWKIVHHHNSVPFYMDDSQRAALDLEPGSGKAQIY
ncbi:YybH family protein [Paracoccus sediminicola]|uniref:YybH family protein n=1 Tax=Paracoccus sediminicola TaxID=3017783 RepID=UPI0022F11836|nr:nuclear transport factor 2 family protein [Paracoccus sediminicola]WBU56828.1 nuclear transport factor 2 family protein [Paracoccus sediminicola]